LLILIGFSNREQTDSSRQQCNSSTARQVRDGDELLAHRRQNIFATL
jgi:hypothetical protein